MKPDTFPASADSAMRGQEALPVLDFPVEPAHLSQKRDPELEAAQVNTAIPHVVAWNITRRCNLECSHCYICRLLAECGERAFHEGVPPRVG